MQITNVFLKTIKDIVLKIPRATKGSKYFNKFRILDNFPAGSFPFSEKRDVIITSERMEAYQAFFSDSGISTFESSSLFCEPLYHSPETPSLHYSKA